MVKLYLNDILRKTGIDLSRIKLIRHAKSDREFLKCYDCDMVEEYTKYQKKGFSKHYDYWIVFVSDKSTSAVLYGCYKVLKERERSTDVLKDGFPLAEWINEEGSYYELERLDCLQDYEGRLMIDWGKATRSWHQRALNEKEVIAIQCHQIVPFEGYDKVILSFNELEEIINDDEKYHDWHTALSSVKGIYLITDRSTGKQYVGSSYGEKGLLQRWSKYIETKHGNNEGLIKLLKQDPYHYMEFQFSILEIFSKSITDDEIVAIENRYKDKLLTRVFGYNDN